MKKVWFIFGFLYVCYFFYNLSFPQYTKSVKQQIVDQVRRKAALNIVKETGMDWTGTQGQMMYEIQELGLSFLCSKPINLSQGRTLILSATQKFLEEINKETKIQKYLYKIPFTAKDVNIDIFIRDKKGKEVPRGDLCLISISAGRVKYQIHSKTGHNFITYFEEAFEEALQQQEQIE